MLELHDRAASNPDRDLLPEFAEAREPFRKSFRCAIPGRGPIAFEELEPAFRLGYEARRRFSRFPFAAVEPHLAAEWSATQRRSRLDWDDVRHAALQAWIHRDELERRASRFPHAYPAGA